MRKLLKRREMTKKTPLKSRVQSPGGHLLTPNDDDLERAQVRIARAAALRRKSGIGAEAGISPQPRASQDGSSVLSKEHILELHSNCIKLAAENVCNSSPGLNSLILSPFLTLSLRGSNCIAVLSD